MFNEDFIDIDDPRISSEDQMSFSDTQNLEDDEEIDSPWETTAKRKKQKDYEIYGTKSYYGKYGTQQTKYVKPSYYGGFTKPVNKFVAAPPRTFNSFNYSNLWNQYSWVISNNEDKITVRKNFQDIGLKTCIPTKTVFNTINYTDSVSLYKNGTVYPRIGISKLKNFLKPKLVDQIFSDVIEKLPVVTDPIDYVIGSSAAYAIANPKRPGLFHNEGMTNLLSTIYDSVWLRFTKTEMNKIDQLITDCFINKKISYSDVRAFFPDISNISEDHKKKIDQEMSKQTNGESDQTPLSQEFKNRLSNKPKNQFAGMWKKQKCHSLPWATSIYEYAITAMRSKFKTLDVVHKEASINKGKRINRSFINKTSYKPLEAKTILQHKKKKLFILCDGSGSMGYSNIENTASAFIKALVDSNIFDISNIIFHSESFVCDYYEDYKNASSKEIFYNSWGGGEWFESLDDNIEQRYIADADYVIVITDLNYSEEAEQWLHRFLTKTTKHLALVFWDLKGTIRGLNTRNVSTVEDMISSVTTMLAH